MDLEAFKRRQALIERLEKVLAMPDLSPDLRAKAERTKAGVQSMLRGQTLGEALPEPGKKQRDVVERRQALIADVDKLLASPGITPENRAKLERSKANLQSLLSAPPQETQQQPGQADRSPLKVEIDARTERLTALQARAEAAVNRPGLSPEKRAAAERVLSGAELLLNPPSQPEKAESPSNRSALLPEMARGTSEHLREKKPVDQISEPQANAEPSWSAARWWTIAGAGGLSVIPILAGPTWHHGDPEAQLGLLIYGPLIVAFLVSCVFIFVDTISSEKDRAEWLSDFAANPLKSILGLIFLFVTMAFFGLLVLGGMGFIPDLGIWYPILIGTSMLILVVGRFL